VAPRRESRERALGLCYELEVRDITVEELLADLHRLLKGRSEEEVRLAEALERFRAAGRALPDGVVILNREHHMEWCNPTAERHFGIDARRDLGQPVTNFVRHPDFVAYMDKGEFGEPVTLRLPRSDAVLQLRLIEFGEERKLLNSRDVTTEERLEIMRRDFVANVSHELRTPLTVLAGFLETIQDLKLDASRVRDYVGLMAPQAERMKRLIDDLLTLSALEHAPPPPSAGSSSVQLPTLK